MEIKCKSVDTFPEVKSELGSAIKRNSEESVLNYFISLDSFKCNSEILWRCFNLRMWKKRKRICDIITRCLTKSDSLRLKREAVEFDVGYVIRGQSSDSEGFVIEPEESLLVRRFKQRWPLDLWRRYGLFTDDYVEYINPHWLRFPPPDPAVYYSLGVLYILMTICGCLGNFIVVFMYIRSVSKISFTNEVSIGNQFHQRSSECRVAFIIIFIKTKPFGNNWAL